MVKPVPLPDIETLRRFFSYDEIEGIVRWRRQEERDSAWNGHFADKEAGCIAPNGYKQIRLNGRGLRYHRVAWVLFSGKDPGFLQIDHINGDRLDKHRVARVELYLRKTAPPWGGGWGKAPSEIKSGPRSRLDPSQQIEAIFRCLAEFDFSYNERGVTDRERAEYCVERYHRQAADYRWTDIT